MCVCRGQPGGIHQELPVSFVKHTFAECLSDDPLRGDTQVSDNISPQELTVFLGGNNNIEAVAIE